MYTAKSLGMAAVSSAFAVLCVTAAQAATLTVTSSLFKGHDQTIAYLKDFHEPVNKADNGITLNYKGGPEVIPNRKQGAALKRGVIDVMFGPSVYYAGLVPCARVIGLSNVGQDVLRKNGGWEALQDCWAKGLNGKLLAHGMEGATEFHIYLTEEYKPLVNDKTGLSLKGFKMRTTAGYTPLFKAMGAVPINISPSDVYTSMERGLVKGLAWPEGGVAAYGWAKFIKYRVGPGWWRTTSTLVMNMDVWNKLTKKEQDVIHAASLKYEKDSIATLRALVKADNEKVFAAGVKPVDLTGKAAEAYMNVVYGATWDAAKDNMPAETYAKLRKLLLK